MTDIIAVEALPHLGKEESLTYDGSQIKVWPQRVALITGVRGQDGSYLAELLLEKNYKVVGVARRASAPNNTNILSCLSNPNFELVTGDVTDYASVSGILNKYKPQEIYNLAAQSFVKASFDQPFHTFEVDTLGVVNFLEVMKKDLPESKFYQASTSEMFGKSYSERKVGYISNVDPATGLSADGKILPESQRSTKFVFPNDVIGGIPEKYQDENTPFMPQSPYGIAKLASHHMVRLYRESYGLHASCGILFNHESPRRGIEFVTRKITDYVAKLYHQFDRAEYMGDTDLIDEFPKLQLGNLDAYRDWGHAKDYVRGMWQMLQQDTSDDYILCTGESHTVRDFCKAAFDVIGVNYEDWVEVNPAFYRPAEVDYLRGVSDKATRKFGWINHYSFEDLVQEMVKADIDAQNL